jgi:DNA processing protein
MPCRAPSTRPMSRGCNDLIREGAGLVTRGWDILQDYAGRWPGKTAARTAAHTAKSRIPVRGPGESREPPAEGAPDAVPLLQGGRCADGRSDGNLRALTDEPMLTDDLIERTQIPARRVLVGADHAGT